jgi:hypothetical protein
LASLPFNKKINLCHLTFAANSIILLSMREAIAPLIAVIDAYQAATGLPDSTISSRVFIDGRKVGHLRGGATISVDRFSGAIRWFSANWPDGAKWPSSVERPEQAVA